MRLDEYVVAKFVEFLSVRSAQQAAPALGPTWQDGCGPLALPQFLRRVSQWVVLVVGRIPEVLP